MNCNVINRNDIDVLNENIKRFWSIDSYGINPKSQLLTPNEKRSLTILENTTTFKKDHFETGLLWKDDHPILPNNHGMAVKRFKVLENRFRKNLEYFQMHKKKIDDYIKLGHAKLLSKEESSNFSNKTNYIPHHGIVNVNKPGTVWVVSDASAKCDNIYLNNKLLPGMDYLNSLIGALTKFRHGKYAIMGDIEIMFLQLKVIEEDLDALHFVWRDSDQDKISD